MAAAGDVSRETLERLTLYLELLRPLAARDQPGRRQHARRPLAPPHPRFAPSSLPHLPRTAAHLVDLGSGAGFPGHGAGAARRAGRARWSRATGARRSSCARSRARRGAEVVVHAERIEQLHGLAGRRRHRPRARTPAPPARARRALPRAGQPLPVPQGRSRSRDELTAGAAKLAYGTPKSFPSRSAPTGVVLEARGSRPCA